MSFGNVFHTRPTTNTPDSKGYDEYLAKSAKLRELIAQGVDFNKAAEIAFPLNK